MVTLIFYNSGDVQGKGSKGNLTKWIMKGKAIFIPILNIRMFQ